MVSSFHKILNEVMNENEKKKNHITILKFIEDLNQISPISSPNFYDSIISQFTENLSTSLHRITLFPHSNSVLELPFPPQHLSDPLPPLQQNQQR